MVLVEVPIACAIVLTLSPCLYSNLACAAADSFTESSSDEVCVICRACCADCCNCCAESVE